MGLDGTTLTCCALGTASVKPQMDGLRDFLRSRLLLPLQYTHIFLQIYLKYLSVKSIKRVPVKNMVAARLVVKERYAAQNVKYRPSFEMKYR